VLGDLNARRASGDGPRRSLGRSARLGVERLELTRSAGHPQKDARPVLLLQLGGEGAEAFAPPKAGQRSRSARCPAQEAAAAHGAPEINRYINACVEIGRHVGLKTG